MARRRRFWVYILANRKNGALYIGVTNDLLRRLWEHREGRGSDFCRRYGLKMLVWYEEFETAGYAIQREKTMKKWPRRWKIDLIQKTNPDWRDLWFDLGHWGV